MAEHAVGSIGPDDHPWISRLLKKYWGSTEVVRRGRVHHADHLPGFVALIKESPVGLITYRIEKAECEIVTLNSLDEGIGIGSKLLAEVKKTAESSGCRRLWLITTNDNTPAIRFYQKRGFVVTAVHRNAIEQSRKLKPQIPETGIDGTPITDEIEMEMMVD